LIFFNQMLFVCYYFIMIVLTVFCEVKNFIILNVAINIIYREKICTKKEHFQFIRNFYLILIFIKFK
jgi:hypothetical protein